MIFFTGITLCIILLITNFNKCLDLFLLQKRWPRRKICKTSNPIRRRTWTRIKNSIHLSSKRGQEIVYKFYIFLMLSLTAKYVHFGHPRLDQNIYGKAFFKSRSFKIHWYVITGACTYRCHSEFSTREGENFNFLFAETLTPILSTNLCTSKWF